MLLIKLASANRETKDQLKMFQDSGGNIVMHFPPEDDPAAHQALKEKFPNLKMLGDDGQGKKSGSHVAGEFAGHP